MTPGLLALAAAASAPAPLALIEARSVVLNDSTVRIRDVVALDRAFSADRARLAPLVIARLPRRARRHSLTRSALVQLIRRRVPGLRIDDAGSGAISFTLPPADRTSSGTGCLMLMRPVARGAPVTTSATAPAPCSAPMRGAVAFDRTRRRLVALRDLDTGTALGRLDVPDDVVIEKGAALRLVARAGPVRVERAVMAMQPSIVGRRVFVRDADGQVYAARLQGMGVAR